MKTNLFSIPFLLVATLAANNLINNNGKNYNEAFCWKSTTTRGAGTVPETCGSGSELIGILCYANCPNGYSRFGFDCHQNCPTDSGWVDQGLFCALQDYGRGVGYPWKFGDQLFDLSGAYSRCEADHGQGNCETWGAIVYPKCSPGYSPAGCCICQPNPPDCNGMGYNGGIGFSCAKHINIGHPTAAGCPPNNEENGFLCYPRCPSGYYGLGPVCWSNTPSGWVGCGMGASPSSARCAAIIFNQVTSVANLAINIATLGATEESIAASKAAASKQLNQLDPELKQMFDSLQQLIKDSQPFKELIQKGATVAAYASTANSVSVALTSNSSSLTNADIVRICAQVAALADPTGIAATVAAYSYPMCSDIST